MSPGPEGDRLCRARERLDRIPLGRESNGSAAGTGGRIGSPSGRRDCREWRCRSGVGSQGGNHNDSLVFIVADDPVGRGLVASLARPGGNATGINFFSAELVAKRMEILRELVPAATRVAVLVNPTGPNAETTVREAEGAARAMGLQFHVLNASTGREIDAAFATLARERPDALFVSGDPFFNTRRVQLALLAARHVVPATYQGRQYAEAGGLMSYGSNLADAIRQVGVYTGRILKGAKPADLPVVQASRFELVINAQTARVLGLTVPPSVLATADEVIE
ncbi:MAG: ABC transporter substrate-binding protein [Xanthobacteraceae bacterium]